MFSPLPVPTSGKRDLTGGVDTLIVIVCQNRISQRPQTRSVSRPELKSHENLGPRDRDPDEVSSDSYNFLLVTLFGNLS